MGLSPTGLHVVRELGAAGVEVIGLAEGFQAARCSRYLNSCLSSRDPQARLSELCGLFPETPEKEAGRPVLIPTSDQDVQFVLDNAERLSRHYAIQKSYRDGRAARILSKDSFYGLCAQHGIAFPAIWKCTRQELLQLLSEVSYPCIVKPARIHELKHGMRGRKVWIARDAGEFRRVADQIPDDAGTLLVQQVIPGPESNITLCCIHMDERGVARQTFTARKLRQFPPGFGSASLVQSSPESETAKISIELLSALAYSGIAALEFKRHQDTGKLYIIEVNVRPSLWFGLSAAASRRVVLSAFQELSGMSEVVPERSQIQGVRWRYLLKDIASALFYRTHPDFVLPAPDIAVTGPARKKVGAVFAWDDPGPGLGELMNFTRKFAARTVGAVRSGGRGAGA